MNAHGYNLCAAGPDGFGKSTSVEMFLRRRAAASPPPLDWVFVHNFDDPDRPQAISLQPGQGHTFANGLRHAVEAGQRELIAAFESESYVRMRQEIGARLERERGELIEGLQAERKCTRLN